MATIDLKELKGHIPLYVYNEDSIRFVQTVKVENGKSLYLSFEAEGDWGKIADYLEGKDLKVEEGIEEVKKAEDWCSSQGGHWITATGKHICIGDDKDIGGGNRERSLISPEHKTKLVYSNKREELAGFATGEYNKLPENLKGRFGEVEINDKYKTWADYYRDKGLPVPENYKSNPPELGGMTRGNKIVIYQGGSERAVLHEYGHMIEPKYEKSKEWESIWGKDKLGESKATEGFAVAYRLYATDSTYFEEEHKGLHGFMDGYLLRETNKIGKAEEGGKWVTLQGGQKVFIRDGETMEDAIGRLKPSKPKKVKVSITPYHHKKDTSDGGIFRLKSGKEEVAVAHAEFLHKDTRYALSGNFKGKSIVIDTIEVEDKYQRKGYGSKLLARVEKEGKKQGMVRSYATHVMMDSIPWWEKKGYKSAERGRVWVKDLTKEKGGEEVEVEETDEYLKSPFEQEVKKEEKEELKHHGKEDCQSCS